MTAPARPLILLLGGNGQVGWELRRALPPLADLIAPDRAALDVADEQGLRDLLRTLRPAAVVNASAYTDVDGAESDRARAFAVNANAPRVMAEETARLGALLVHFSTDYIFDGRATLPYAEDAATAPLNVYGESKLVGEQAIAAAGGPHLILRSCWIYGLRGRNFLRTMLRLARERPVMQVVEDQVGCPTWSRMLAEASAALLARLAQGPAFASTASGVFHVCAAGRASWWEFARAILELDACSQEHVVGEVRPIRTHELPRPAARPAFSVLDCGRFASVFGLRLPAWDEQLALAMDAQNRRGAAAPVHTT